MKTPFVSNHFSTADGIPEGGQTFGPGFAIAWQRGPLGRGADRIEPNGAFVETVIAAVIDRIEHYQKSKFNCVENSAALIKLHAALECLNSRTQKREAAGIEGTHAV